MTQPFTPTPLPENTHILELADEAVEEGELDLREFRHHVAHAFYYSGQPGADSWDYQDFTYLTYFQGVSHEHTQIAIKVGDDEWVYKGRFYDSYSKVTEAMWDTAVFIYQVKLGDK